MGKGFKETFGMVFPSNKNEENKGKNINVGNSQEMGERLKNLKSKIDASEIKQSYEENTPSPQQQVNNQNIIAKPENNPFTGGSDKIRIAKPSNYGDVQKIGQAIKDGKAVILHMDRLKEDVAIEIHQFILGVCFACDIVPEKVDNKIFLIEPKDDKKR